MASNNELTITIKANSATAEAALNKIIDRVGVLADRADKSTSIASSGFSKLSAVAVAVGNIIANVVSGAWAKMIAQIDSAIRRFDTMNNFPKVMANLGIAADKSQVAIQKISDKLKGLPTALDTATMGVQRLVAKNGDLDKSVDLFLALNNAVLAGGAPTELQTAAIEQLTQAYAKGKPDMMEWRSIMTAMPAQLTQVAKAMGFVNADALGEALRNGEVSMDSFMDTVNRLNKEGVAGFSNFEQQARAATGGIQTGIANMETAITRGWTKILDAIGSENINNALANIGARFEWLLSKAADFINFLQSHSKEVDIFATSIVGLTGVIGVLATVSYWDDIVTHLDEVGKGFKGMFSIFTKNPILAAILLIASALTIFFTKTETGQKLLRKFGEIAGKAFDAIGPAVETVGNVIGQVFSSIGSVLQNLAAQVGPVLVEMFSSLGSAVSQVLPFISQLIGEFGQIVNSLFPALLPLVEAIVNLFVTLGKSVVQIAVAIFNAIKPLIPLIIQIVVTVASLVAQIATALVPIFQLVITLIAAVIAAFIPIVTVVIQVVAQVIAALVPIITFIVQLVATIISAIMPIVTFIASVIVSIMNIVLPIVTFIINLVMGIITVVINIISGIIGFITGIITTIINIIGGIIQAVADIISAIVKFFSDGFSGILDFIKKTVESIIKFFTSIPDKIGGVVEKIIGFFSGIGKKIGDFISEGFKGIINGALGLVEGFLNSPIKLINGALDLINKIPGVNISKITEIKLPRMAEGGILGGNSYSGDKQLFAGNTGEMIINRRDQSALWNAIKSGQFGSDSSTTVNFADGAIIVNAAPNQKPADIAVEVVQAIQTAFISQGVPVDLKRAGELRA